MEKNCNNCRFLDKKSHGCVYSSYCVASVSPYGSEPSHWQPISYRNYSQMYRPKSPKQIALERIKNVIFNDPVTVVIWSDGTKTIVRCGKGETYDPEKGLAMAISKYFFDNKGYFNDVFKKWLPEEEIITESEPIAKVNEIIHDENGITIKTSSVYVTVKQFCDTKNITKDKAYRMIKRGEIDAYKNDKNKWMIKL